MRIDQLATQSPATLQALKELLGVTQLDVFVAQLNYQANRIANLAAVPGPQGIQGDTGSQGVPGADGKSAYEVAVENGFTGTEAEWVELMLAPSLPDGGTAGQSLRKVDGTDGNAEWSSHWVVDPVTGKMSQVPVNRLRADPVIQLLDVSGHTITDGLNISKPAFRIDDRMNMTFSAEYSYNGSPFTTSTQGGFVNLQRGSRNVQTDNAYASTQLAWKSTQSSIYGTQIGMNLNQSGTNVFQMGSENIQSGWINTQSACYSTQSGSYNTQSGSYLTQTGNWGAQFGKSLNNGGFNYVTMFGLGPKTATVTQRAYFSLDNGIWLKPRAGDAASPENGVLAYNSTLGKFRFYQNGGWKSYLTESDPTFSGVLQTATSYVGDYAARVAPDQILFTDNATYGTINWTSRFRTNVKNGFSFAITSATLSPASSQTSEASFQFGQNVAQQGMFQFQSATRSSQNYGFASAQFGDGNTQSGGYNCQFGTINTQSGYSNLQAGGYHTQSGSYSAQFGNTNVQSGDRGFQAGFTLNDGGFDYAFMVGASKTATAAKRAYFAMDNGIWIKPVAAAPASPENGVIYYDSTTHKFRGYANGAWVDLH